MPRIICLPLLPPQLVNAVFFLAPNVFVLANPCGWFLRPIYVFTAVRWTCLNTVGRLSKDLLAGSALCSTPSFSRASF